MSDRTSIEWTDATWNVVTGCSVVSPGCTNCYAMRLAGTRMRHHPSRQGLTVPSKAGPVWNGTVRFNDKVLLDPLRWKHPRKIFVCAHGDLFHDSVPDEWIDRVFAVMALAPQHTFQVLTKRPERMRRYFAEPSYIDGAGQQRGRELEVYEQWRKMRDQWRSAEPWTLEFDWSFREPRLGGCAAVLPLSNVWLGVSVEDQQRADQRIPVLLDTPAAVRWLSCEPLLGPVDLNEWFVCPNWSDDIPMDPTTGLRECCRDCDYTGIAGFSGAPIPDWVVVGGESGPGARPMHPDWARSLRDQCAAAGVPFLFKQWGEWGPGECGGVRLDRGYATATWFDDEWYFDRSGVSRGDEHIDDEPDLYRCGKRAAGRLLDGVQHDAFPALPAPGSQCSGTPA